MSFSDRFPEIRALSAPRPRWQLVLLGLLVLILLLGGSAAGALWYISRDLPSLDSLQEYQPSLVSRVYSGDRQVIGQFYVERRILVTLSDVPQSLTQAVIAVEDARFFEHPGLDVIGILRAVLANMRHGGKVGGGSTNTPQTPPFPFFFPGPTLGKKGQGLVPGEKN